MAVQDYYFALQNLSNSDKIFGYYSGSATFDYNFDYRTGSNNLGTYEILLNSGSLGSGGGTNESQTDRIYLDDKTLDSGESIISYLTKLDDIPDKGQIKIEVSGSSDYYLIFNVEGIQVGSSVSSMIITSSFNSSNAPFGDANNPISSSISSSGGTDLSPRLTVTFTGSELRGYHEIDVTGSSTYYLMASSGSFGTPPTGSIPKPFNIDWGVPESTFIDPDYYPTTRGYTWLWNDGYKVKHIKMNNISSTGDILTDFIKHSEWARFVMYNPINVSRNLIHTGNGFYTEDYQLFNVTKYSSQNYTHLFVDQNNKDTSFAVDVSPQDNITDTFKVTGDYIVYASSSGNTINPVITTGIDKSIPQGYFPSPDTDYPAEQFFRGWAGANYYVNGNLVPYSGILDDPLQSFFTGSTERDKDSLPNYVPSVLPFFIDASASYQEIQSSSFVEFNFQSNLVRIGPSFTTEAGSGETIYYYKEDTGQIVIRGSQYLNIKKSEAVDYEPLYNTQLVGPNNTTTINYETPEGFTIPVLPSQSLWLSRGIAPIGTKNGNLYKYNRYLHRPYKTYIVTSTGSAESGYGNQVYGRDAYGTPGSSPVGPPPNEFGSVYVAYSSSEASARPVDGIYTFNQPLIEPLLVSASVDLSYTSITPLESSSYGTASYTDVEFQYGGTGSGEDVLTWQTATLNLYQNNTIIQSQPVSITHDEIINGITLDLDLELQTYQVSPGDTLRLSLAVSDEPVTFNSSLLATSYTMSFNNLVYPSNDLTPVIFNNYLEVNDDCDPLVNNVVGDRPNARLQDVDYSVSILTPVNLAQILKDEAVRATVPESNYTQTGYSEARYDGTKSNTALYNKWTQGDTGTYGKLPNIELKNAYFAYFSKIYDLYPILEGTTALEIKYIFDANGNRFNPRLGDFNFFNLSDTFTPKSVINLSTNIKDNEELTLLNRDHNIKLVGEKPIPILYTQTGGREYTGSISFTGFKPPQPDPPTFNNYSFKATGSDFPTEVRSFSEQQLSPNSGISSSAVNVTQSYFPSSGDIIIPITDHLAPNGAGSGKVPSDTYSLNIEHIFETTPIKRILTTRKQGFFEFGPDKYKEEVGTYEVYSKVNGQLSFISNYDVKLEIAYKNSNVSSGVEYKSFNYKSVFPNNIKVLGNKLTIIFQSANIKQYMESKGWSTSISSDHDGNGENYSGTWLKCRWIVTSTIRPKTTNFWNAFGTGFKQGDTINVFHAGNFIQKDSDAGFAFQNNFFPTLIYSPSIQSDTFNFNGNKTNAPQGAVPPYWVFDTSGGSNISDTLIMESEDVNEAYNNNLKQIDIPYTSSTWPTFPRGEEPDFVQFPSITEYWSLELKDQIKFENNENKVYSIVSITPPSENGGKLKVVVSPPIEDQTTNLDFFVVRRFIEEKGTIILSTPKPYLFPSSASSAPGILLPEYTVEEINEDPNLILKDLEDKKLIE